MTRGNLFAALRAAFPADLDQVAIETADSPVPLHYTWRDLDRGTAMIANLLESLELPSQAEGPPIVAAHRGAGGCGAGGCEAQAAAS